jgi:hypothetical protein
MRSSGLSPAMLSVVGSEQETSEGGMERGVGNISEYNEAHIDEANKIQFDQDYILVTRIHAFSKYFLFL